jgi:hypothetical protein
MPAWTLQQLNSRVSRAVGRRADISESDLSFWVNEAYQEVTEVAPHILREAIAVSSTTSGENRIALPSDFREPRVLSWLTNIGSQRTLQQVSGRYADANFDRNAQGVPEKYVLWNDWIELLPSPNSAWSLQWRYISRATSMVSRTDVPSISTPWRRAIYLKAKELIFSEHLGDLDRAALARDQYLDLVRLLPDERALRQRASDRQYLNPVYIRRGRR